MNIKLLSTVVFCMVYYCGHSQPNEFTVSYFGKQGTHPGIKASTSVYTKVLGHSLSEKTIKVTPSIGGYWHYRNHVGLFINTEISFSFLFKNNFMWEVYTGVGYLRTFLGGTVYTVSDNLDVARKHLAGNNMFMPMAGIGIGRKHQEESPFRRSFFRLGVFFQYPHNTMWLLNPCLEIGTAFGFEKN